MAANMAAKCNNACDSGTKLHSLVTLVAQYMFYVYSIQLSASTLPCIKKSKISKFKMAAKTTVNMVAKYDKLLEICFQAR